MDRSTHNMLSRLDDKYTRQQKKLKALFIIANHNHNKEVTIHSDGLTLLTGSSRDRLGLLAWHWLEHFLLCIESNPPPCGIGGNF